MSQRDAKHLRCGSCGERAAHFIVLDGFDVPACLRHVNVWRAPDFPVTDRDDLATLTEVRLTDTEQDALDEAIHLPVYNPIRQNIHAAVECILAGRLTAVEGVETVEWGVIPDPTPTHGMDWRNGLDALDALLNDCSQIGADHENFVRVQAARHVVNAVRRWEHDTDESIRSALWEDAVANGEPWAVERYDTE